MYRIYCDRCKKQVSRDNLENLTEEAQDHNEGDYIGTIYKVIACDDREYICVPSEAFSATKVLSKDTQYADLCPKCKKEFSELLAEFMKGKCKK